MTPGEWDTHYWRIYDQLRQSGYGQITAGNFAEQECTEQFGDRPREEETA